MKKLIRFTVAAAFAFALVFGAASLFTEAEAARCICPQLYAPVRCDNGKTYVNPCYASCAKAKNCVPTGDI
jgi:hypothetical protein